MDPYLAKTSGGHAERNHPAGSNPDESYFGLVPDPYWEALRTSMGHTRCYAEKIDLVKMTPHGELSSSGYCLAAPETAYLVFNPESKVPFEARVGKGTYHFEWFDINVGEIIDQGEIRTGQGNNKFTVPFDGPAVLYLEKTGTEYF